MGRQSDLQLPKPEATATVRSAILFATPPAIFMAPQAKAV